MRIIWTGLLVFVLMASVLLFIPMNSFSENISVEGTKSVTQPKPTIYINGDWVITDTQVVESKTIILTGNLTVQNGGNLTFKNVTLELNCSSLYQYHINVEAGGAMYIFDLDNDNTTTDDASNITVTDPTNRAGYMGARDGSVFRIRNSRVSGFGYGIYLNTDNAIVDRTYITDCLYGIYMNNSDATISNNTITWNDRTGIEATVYSNATIENNWITWNGVYGIDINGWDNTNGPWPSNPIVKGNVVADTGQGNPGGVGITVDYSCKPLIKDTHIIRSTEDGFYSGYSTPTLINVTIDAGGIGNYGIASSATGYIYIINCTIINTKLKDFSIAGAPGSFFVVTNSTFNESKVWIDSSGNLTVKWYLHIFVRDSNHDPIPAADVRVRDNENGTYDKNFSTDTDGYVKWIVLTEYWQNSTTKIYYTPYNIRVSYGNLNFTNNPRNSTLNESKTEVFIATTPVPEFENIIIPVILALAVGVAFLRKKEGHYRK